MKANCVFCIVLFCSIIKFNAVTSYDFEEEYKNEYLKRFYEVSSTTEVSDSSKSSTTESTSTEVSLPKRQRPKVKGLLSIKVMDEVKDALKKIFEDRDDVDANLIEALASSTVKAKQSVQRSIQRNRIRGVNHKNKPTKKKAPRHVKGKSKPVRSTSQKHTHSKKNYITRSVKKKHGPKVHKPSRTKGQSHQPSHVTNKKKISRTQEKNRRSSKNLKDLEKYIRVYKNGKVIEVLRQNDKENSLNYNIWKGFDTEHNATQENKDINTETTQQSTDQDVSQSTDQESSWIVTSPQGDYQGASLITDKIRDPIIDQNDNQIEDKRSYQKSKGKHILGSSSKDILRIDVGDQNDIDIGRTADETEYTYTVVYEVVSEVSTITLETDDPITNQNYKGFVIGDEGRNQVDTINKYMNEVAKSGNIHLALEPKEIVRDKDLSTAFDHEKDNDDELNTTVLTQPGPGSWPPEVWSGTFDFETPTKEPTTKSPKFDLAALLDIIANLTYDYETNLTRLLNVSLQRFKIPTCGTPSTAVTPTTTQPPGYDYWENGTGTVMGKCFVCGLQETGIPYYGYCGDAFASDFIPLTPVNAAARGQISHFRKYCRYLDIVGTYMNESDPKSLWGRWTGGCGVRWIDLTTIYSQRTCRNRLRATLGKHYLSKRMAKLEMALQHVENGCVISPVASLVPMSRGINLYGRFHACVCTQAWCNPGEKVDPNVLVWVWSLVVWFVQDPMTNCGIKVTLA